MHEHLDTYIEFLNNSKKFFIAPPSFEQQTVALHNLGLFFIAALDCLELFFSLHLKHVSLFHFKYKKCTLIWL